jgi:DNA polymerase-3 subunit beta
LQLKGSHLCLLRQVCILIFGGECFSGFMLAKRRMIKLLDSMVFEETDSNKDQEVNAAKITVKIKDIGRFASIISTVEKACAKSDSVPVLQGIKMEIKKQIPKKGEGSQVTTVLGNALFLTGGNGLSSLILGTASLEGAADAVAEADQEICTLLPGKAFSGLIKKLPAGAVRLVFESNKVTIHAGKSEFSMSTLDASLYTVLEPDAKEVITFDAKAFCSAIEATVYAVTKVESSNPSLCGIHLESTERGLKFESTNRSQAAIEVLSSGSTSLVNATISEDAAREIVRVFNDVKTIRVAFGTGRVAISGQGVTLISSLLDGIYPDLSRAIPTSFVAECVYKREDLEAALERALILAGDKGSRSILLTLKNEELLLKSKSELGAGGESIPVLESSGTIKISLDAKLALSSSKSMGAIEKVRLKFAGPLLPCLLVPVTDSTEALDSRQAVLIPLRSSEV